MSAPVISTSPSVFTLITVHHCTAQDQPQLTALLTEAAERAYCHLPGFLSASVHRSLDGQRVTNYAQWRSQAEFEAVRGRPEVAPYIERIRGLISDFDAHLYEVSAVVAVAD